MSAAPRKGPAEKFLQGFVRVKASNQNKILQHLSEDGLFIEHLASDASAKPVVFWRPPLGGEQAREYLARIVGEAKKEKTTIAHRRGGGTYLGLHVPKGKHQPQKHAWLLKGAPRIWDSQDVLKCLLDAGAKDVEVIRPPGRVKAWLLKATVSDSNDLGVTAIAAGSLTLLLTRAQAEVARKVDTVEVLKGPLQAFNEPKASRVPLSPAPEKPKPVSAPPGAGGQKDDEGRANSRSPRHKSKDTAVVAFPCEEKFDKVDCGGQGACGYLCLAAGLGYQRGQTFEAMKDELPARAATIRNDIFKHVTNVKHEASYQAFFEPDSLATSEEKEDGPIPRSWEEWTQATLRPGRWIDGLSILGASKRYGECIIVVPTNEDDKNRPMMFGTLRTGKEPIVLLLSAGHYQLARLKPGCQWPKEWTAAEPAEIKHVMLRAGGGGKEGAEVPSTPVRAGPSWKVAATPETWRPGGYT